MPLTDQETTVLDDALRRIDGIAMDALEGDVRKAIGDEIASMSRKIEELKAEPRTPESLEDLRNTLVDACSRAGLTVLGTGHGYSNGPYEDFAVRLSSFDSYVEISEFVQDDYEESDEAPGASEREQGDHTHALVEETKKQELYGERMLGMRVEDMEPDVGDGAV